MASVIDKFVIALGLDASEYEKSAKKVIDSQKKIGESEDKSSKRTQANNKKIAEGYKDVKLSILGVVAAAKGAESMIQGFFSSMAAGQARLGRSAKDFNMDPKRLDAWGAAMETVGGKAEDAATSFQSIFKAMQDLKEGKVSDVLQTIQGRLGVSMKDAAGNMRPVNDIMLDIAKAMEKLNPQDQRTFAEKMGFNEATLQLLRMGQSSLSQLIDEQERNSEVTAESVKQAQEAQKAIAELTRAYDSLKQSLFAGLAPALKDVVGILKDTVDLFKQADHATDGWSTKIIAILGTIATSTCPL